MLSVERGLGHPWSDEPGWDRLIVTGRKELLHRAASDAREKWWRQLCVVGDVAVFYKPSGATAPWDDKEHWLGFDSEGAVALKRGDVVITKFSGAPTAHVVEGRFEKDVPQTGLMLKVSPDVPTSGGGWINAAWFKRAGWLMMHDDGPEMVSASGR